MIYDIVLNLEKSGIKPRVKVSQYDKTLPQIRASLYCNNQAFNIPSGSTVFIMGTKKDNTGFEYECTYENNVVTATITDQMTVFAGDVECEFTINTSDSRKGTENFILEVEPCALSDEVQISETDIPIIQHITDYIAEANEYAELSHSWANYGDNSAEPTADNNSKHWSDVSHNWANYGDSATSPSATNNAKYWSDMAQQYAQGGLTYRGSILFANIPTTGMVVGDMYNMEDNFTTDSRFQEGSGISVKAGTNIAWNGTKWDLLAVGGVGAISELSDVTLTTPTDGQILKYNGTTQKWENATESGSSEELSAIENVYGAKNLNSTPYYEGSKVESGLTFVVNDDGSITVSGTAERATEFVMHNAGQQNPLKLSNGTYKVTGGINSNASLKVGHFVDGNYTIVASDNGDGATFTATEDKYSFVISILSGTDLSTPITFKPMIRDARITDDTFVPYAMTNRELTTKTSGLSNRNLVDNPCFTVNQKNFSSENITGGVYKFYDRWQIYSSNSVPKTISVSNNMLTILISNDTSIVGEKYRETHLRQSKDLTSLIGKTFTLSIKLSNGDIFYQTKKIIANDKNIFFDKVRISDTPIYVIAYLCTNPSEYNYNYIDFDFYTNMEQYSEGDISVTIAYIKLEPGSESTIDKDIEPDYATELLKCQRYFYRVQSGTHGVIALVCGYNSSTSGGVLELPVQMRANPSNNAVGAFELRDGDNYLSVTSVAALSSASSPKTQNIIASGSSLTSGKTYTLVASTSSSYIDFSAEL